MLRANRLILGVVFFVLLVVRDSTLYSLNQESQPG